MYQYCENLWGRWVDHHTEASGLWPQHDLVDCVMLLAGCWCDVLNEVSLDWVFPGPECVWSPRSWHVVTSVQATVLICHVCACVG